MASANTIIGLFEQQVGSGGERTALLERQGSQWVSFSWQEWNARARAVAAALSAEGVKPGSRVAIFSYTRRQWIEADIGVLMTGAVTVTIYQNLVGDTVEHILNDSEVELVFAEGPIQLGALFAADGKPLGKSVKRVVYFAERQTPMRKPGGPEPVEIGLDEAVPAASRELLISFEELIEKGRALLDEQPDLLDERIAGIAPDDLAKIVYTSGTTGMPKGAMLSHGNLTAVVDTIDTDLGLVADDKILLFLPLAHVYAQLAYHAALRVGFTIAFARSMLTAIDDCGEVRPDFFVAVPRLFEKLHAGLLAKVESGSALKQKIFHWATGVGRQVSALRQRGQEPGGALKLKYKLADKLVFSKLKERLGGRIRFVVSGGAPLQRHLIEFFHAADLLIVEGYGMTENASLSHFNRPHRFKFGTVGPSLDNTEVVIAEDGEILVRGPGVMAGYQNLPEATAEVLDADGWLHTGDIGVIDDEGFLTITDRKKDILVTSGGKNIAPAPIEAALSKIRLVSQAVVFGDRRKFLSALLTLDREYAEDWAAEHGVAARGDALAEDPALLAQLDAEVKEVNAGLDPFSTIKKFAVLPREFSMEEGEVTPSLKLKRKVIEKRYQEVISGLYPEG